MYDLVGYKSQLFISFCLFHCSDIDIPVIWMSFNDHRCQLQCQICALTKMTPWTTRRPGKWHFDEFALKWKHMSQYAKLLFIIRFYFRSTSEAQITPLRPNDVTSPTRKFHCLPKYLLAVAFKQHRLRLYSINIKINLCKNSSANLSILFLFFI